MNADIIQKMKKTVISAETIVEPTGVEASIEMMIPTAAHITEIIAEQMITPRKLLKSRIADRAGKMMSADMSREPTRFIARTMIKAVIMAISRLYASELIPVALEKLSSKVTLNILL